MTGMLTDKCVQAITVTSYYLPRAVDLECCEMHPAAGNAVWIYPLYITAGSQKRADVNKNALVCRVAPAPGSSAPL